ncbi:MAG: hypothetical protein ABI443_02260 [Chthoniobacterales bacterium]
MRRILYPLIFLLILGGIGYYFFFTSHPLGEIPDLSKLISTSSVPTTYAGIVANHALWPKEVTLRVSLKTPIMVNGKEAGFSTVAAGTTCKVLHLTSDGRVEILVNGSKMAIAQKDTDLMERVGGAASQKP